MPNRFEVAILGAGVAGASAAIRLARAGMRVALIDKEARAHHKVCGEFMSGEGVDALRELGVDARALGGSSVSAFRIHSRRRFFESSLPKSGVGLSRFCLDSELLELAARSGVQLFRGHTIRSLETADQYYRLASPTSMIETRSLVLASGKLDFAPFGRRVGLDDGQVGFKLHLRLNAEEKRELGDRVELFVFDGGYAGLCGIEGDVVNLCFLLARDLAKKAPRDSQELVAWMGEQHPVLRRRLMGAAAEFRYATTIASIPFGYIRERAVGPHIYAIGDQAAVIPSLTGDGMSMALMGSAWLERTLMQSKSEDASREFQAALAQRLRTQVGFGFIAHRVFKNALSTEILVGAARVCPPMARWAYLNTRALEREAGGRRPSVESFFRRNLSAASLASRPQNPPPPRHQ